MPILNYTTSISAEKTVGEITSLLIKAKACATMLEHEDGCTSAVAFKIQTKYGLMCYRLPANIQLIHQVLVRQKISGSYKTKEQAARVAWRIVKDWLEAQLAIIEAGMVDVCQVFLPYMQGPDGTTLYEALEAKEFDTRFLLEDRP